MSPSFLLSTNFVANTAAISEELEKLTPTCTRELVLQVNKVLENSTDTQDDSYQTILRLFDGSRELNAIFNHGCVTKHEMLKTSSIIRLYDWEVKWYQKHLYFQNYELLSYQIPPQDTELMPTIRTDYSSSTEEKTPKKKVHNCVLSTNFVANIAAISGEVEELKQKFATKLVLQVNKVWHKKSTNTQDGALQTFLRLSDGSQGLNAIFNHACLTKHEMLKTNTVIHLFDWEVKWNQKHLSFQNFEILSYQIPPQETELTPTIRTDYSKYAEKKKPKKKVHNIAKHNSPKQRRHAGGKLQNSATHTEKEESCNTRDSLDNVFRELKGTLHLSKKILVDAPTMTGHVTSKAKKKFKLAQGLTDDILDKCLYKAQEISGTTCELPPLFTTYKRLLKKNLQKAETIYSELPSHPTALLYLTQLMTIEDSCFTLIRDLKKDTDIYIKAHIAEILGEGQEFATLLINEGDNTSNDATRNLLTDPATQIHPRVANFFYTCNRDLSSNTNQHLSERKVNANERIPQITSDNGIL